MRGLFTAMDVIFYILLIFFFAEIVRSAIGFGNALIAMPLLVLFLDLQTATPLFALACLPASIAIIATSWRDIHLKDARQLLIGSFVGIPVGIWVLNNVPREIGIGVLAVMIILYGIYSLWASVKPQAVKTSQPPPENDRLAYVVGAISGVTTAAFNIGGPPAVVYGTFRRWPPAHFRATLQSYFFISGTIVMFGHGLSGLWTREVLGLFLWTIPVTLTATFIGGRINQHIPQETFRRIINVFLIINGVFMLVRL